eukprot:11348-Heterococcus_DN1.PRE.2
MPHSILLSSERVYIGVQMYTNVETAAAAFAAAVANANQTCCASELCISSYALVTATNTVHQCEGCKRSKKYSSDSTG